MSNKDAQSKLEAEEQLKQVRLQALARTYEQADRVITGDPIRVHLAPSGPAPAWSDGKSVTFNMAEIEEFDIEELVQLNGLNYHELSHLEYTPRKSSKLVEWVLENNLMAAFNMLEDQRIETLLTGRFPSVVPYLQATIARWLANTPQDVSLNYVCIRGRRYLPLKVREMFRDSFIDQSLVPVIAKIVDEYRLLAFPDDADRGMELIKEFEDKVLSKMPRNPTDGGPGKCANRPPVAAGRPAKGKRQRIDARRSSRSSLPEDKTDQIEEVTEADVTVDQDQALEARNEAVKRFELKPGESSERKAGLGHVESTGGVPEDFNKVLERTIEDAMSRKDVQADVKARQRVILGGDGKHTGTLKTGKYDTTDVPQNVLLIAKKFQHELEKLRSDAEPQWDRETPSGKLNVGRLIRGCDDLSVLFDRWDEGNDSTDLEVVILVDRSGSMSSDENDRLASQACWVIKRAMEAVEAPVTVYAFDDRSEIAYTRDEKAERTKYRFIYGNGGTEPSESIMDAERLMMSSKAKSKIMFLITDGDFYGDKSDPAISRMKDIGVLTVMALIQSPNSWGYNKDAKPNYHGSEIGAKVDSAAMLLPLARSVVVNAIKKRAR